MESRQQCVPLVRFNSKTQQYSDNIKKPGSQGFEILQGDINTQIQTYKYTYKEGEGDVW